MALSKGPPLSPYRTTQEATEVEFTFIIIARNTLIMSAQISPPFSTPIKLKQSGADRFCSTQQDIHTRRQKIEEEMRGYFVGPMPAEDFLREFMPCAPNPCPTVDFSVVSGHQKEVDMYQPFVSFVRPSLGLSPYSHI